MPLPLVMMIPFMGIQSMVMAKQFGENFQFGKRRISAMSNEEFNKTTMTTMLEETRSELKSMIPNMQQSIADMRPMADFIIKEFMQYWKQLVDLGFQVGSAGAGGVAAAVQTPAGGLLGPIPSYLAAHAEESGGSLTKSESDRAEIYYTTIQNMTFEQVGAELSKIRNGTFPWGTELTIVLLKPALETRYNILVNQKRTTGDTLGPIIEPLPTRSQTSDEVKILAFRTEMKRLFDRVNHLSSAFLQEMQFKTGTVAAGTGATLSSTVITAWKVDSRKRRAEYYNFISLHRNSLIYAIKIEAVRAYKSRFTLPPELV